MKTFPSPGNNPELGSRLIPTKEPNQQHRHHLGFPFSSLRWGCGGSVFHHPNSKTKAKRQEFWLPEQCLQSPRPRSLHKRWLRHRGEQRTSLTTRTQSYRIGSRSSETVSQLRNNRRVPPPHSRSRTGDAPRARILSNNPLPTYRSSFRR